MELSDDDSCSVSSAEFCEKTPLIYKRCIINAAVPYRPISERPKPLLRRWFILFLYSLLTFSQSMIWNTWGPIAQSAKAVFPGLTNKDIALLSAWGSITYLIFMIPLCWLLNAKGLRWGIVTTGMLQLVGTGFRCFRLSTICIHVGQFLNGAAGVILSASPSMLSVIWFPVNERTTATAIACQMSSLGTAAAFVLGPVFVRSPAANGSNATLNIVASNATVIEDDIKRLMVWEFFGTFLLMGLIVFYFPKKPYCPPSYSAFVPRISFKSSIITFFSFKDSLLLMLAYGISSSIFGCWTSVMDLSLDRVGISQDQAGWIGFYMTLVGTIGSIFVARLSDCFSKKLKPLIMFFISVPIICYVLFILVMYQVLKVDIAFFYVILIIMGFCMQSLSPLFLELAAELAYPVDEGVIAGILSGIWNLIGTIFLMLFWIPNIGVLWMNWCLLLSSFISVPLLWFVKESYRRSGVDEVDSNLRNAQT